MAGGTPSPAPHPTKRVGVRQASVGDAAVFMSSYWSVCEYVLGGIQGKLDEAEGLHPLKGERKEEE